VKYSRILAALLGALSLFMSGCGTSDKIANVSMTVNGTTGVVNLIGLGGTLPLAVHANYTSGKWIDETNYAKYTVTAMGIDVNSGQALQPSPATLAVSSTGVITATDPAVCTWVNLGTSTQQAWAYQGWYEITATYRGFTSEPVYIPVASAASIASNTNGQCGPTPTGN
jgi:hypothetical protein